VNGDTLAEFSLTKMEALHERQGACVTVLCRRMADATGRGTLVIGKRREILRFDEKIAAGLPGLINCGFYLMEKGVTQSVAPGRAISLEREIFPRLLKDGLKLAAFETSGAFVDIGTPEEYLRVRDRGWR
jgi:NDP-sugar pyrophosphorylase family protein